MNRRAVVAALLALAGATSCAPPDDAVAPPIIVGAESEDPELASFLTDRAQRASTDAGSAVARGQLAMAYDANGFTDAAIDSYAQAAALDADEFLWPYLGALLLADTGEYDRALNRLDQALTIDPDYAPGWLWRGNWLMDLGRVEEAASAFQHARRGATEETGRAAADVGLARVLLAQGNAQEAHELLNVLAEEALHPYILRLLARSNRVLGKEAAPFPTGGTDAPALEWTDPRRAQLQDHVRGFDGRLQQAERLLSRGEAEAALEILEPLRKQRPGDRTLLNNLAIAYATTGKPATAMATLQEGLEQHGDYYLFHINAAAAYEERGDLRAALTHTEQALALQPAFPPAHERKVALLIAMQRHDEALTAAEAAIDQGAPSAELLYRAGVLEGARGRWNNAITHFAAAVDFSPTFAQAHLALGRSLGEAGRHDEAHAALTAAERLGAPAAEVVSARRRVNALAPAPPS